MITYHRAAPLIVLVADADPGHRELLQDVLSALLPCRVVKAVDTNAALLVLQTIQLDLVLVDQDLPPDGAGRVLQALPLRDGVPAAVIVLADRAVAPRTLDLDSRIRVLPKPCTMQALQAAIGGILLAPRRDYATVSRPSAVGLDPPPTVN